MCRPDGEKKAYVRLLADYDALDVANKVCDSITLSLLNYYFMQRKSVSQFHAAPTVCNANCVVVLLWFLPSVL